MSEYDDFVKWTEENTFITVDTYEELNKYVDEVGIIKSPLEIRGLHITKLVGIKKVTQHFPLACEILIRINSSPLSKPKGSASSSYAGETAFGEAAFGDPSDLGDDGGS